MGTLAADVRYAVRMMVKHPGFTAVAVAALALGIGANTAIFTVVNAVLLDPLPYFQAERIMLLGRQFPDGVGFSNSIPKYMVWRQNQVFESMALYGRGPGMKLGAGDRPEQVKSGQVSRDYFKVFAVSPSMGRTFTAEEDAPDGPKVTILSHALWQFHFGGDPQIVGRTIPLNGEPYTVVGVLPDGFHPEPPADLWVPLAVDPHSTNQGHYLTVAGRLKPGVSIPTARSEMKLRGEAFRREYPDRIGSTESVAVVHMREAMVRDVKPALLILLAAVAFVLLIACANVANLLLARAAVRQREFAIRAAIGAGRWRVVRQLLTESVLLAGLGGLLGFALGAWGVRALLLLVPGNIPRLTDAAGPAAAVPPLDWRIAAFTIGVSALTGILFGLFPALDISNPDLAATLKETSGRSGTGRRQNRARSVLVVSEVALALVLLVGAALLIRTFMGLRAVKPGIDVHNVLTVQTSMAGSAYSTTAKVDNFTTQVVRRLESLPGVEAAASAVMLPMQGGGIDLPFNIVGKAPPKGDQYNGDEQWRSVSPHYFRAFRIPLLRGRVFTETDTGNAARVVVINEALAKKYWPKEDPIGQVMVIGKGLEPEFDDPPRQIVGVVGTVRETGLGDGDVCVMYLPQSQNQQAVTALVNSVIPLSWAVRTAMNPLAMRSAVEREFHAVDMSMPVSNERTMEQVVSESVARQDFNMLLLSIFAGIALLLAAIGIYGLMSYAVEQRTQEIGIRMALGAEQRDMVGLVLWQGMKLAVIGVALGLGLAYLAARQLASLLFGVKASDPLTFGAVAAILTAVALVATYVPARRAAAVDPAESLRSQ